LDVADPPKQRTPNGSREPRRWGGLAGRALTLPTALIILGLASVFVGVPRYRGWRQQGFVVGTYPARVRAERNGCATHSDVVVDAWLDAPPPTAAEGHDLSKIPAKGWNVWGAMTNLDTASRLDGQSGTFTLYSAGAGNGNRAGSEAYATFTSGNGVSVEMEKLEYSCFDY
jgi:hypothetical protein